MTVIFLDAKNAIYRYGWTQRNLTDDSGRGTGAISGLLDCLLSFSKRFHDVKFVACWDGIRSRQSWRATLFPDYKRSRIAQAITPEKELELANRLWQVRKLHELFALLGIVQIEDPDTEADDLIGILAERVRGAGYPSVVYTNDQDYWQLLSRGVSVMASVGTPLTDRHIRAKFHCDKIDLLKVRALLGDKSDGIPRAVPGVGEVSAAKYVAMGVDPSLPDFAEMPLRVRLQVARFEQHWPTVHMNYRLMRIPKDYMDVEIPLAVRKRLAKDTTRVMTELRASTARSRKDYARFLALLTELGLLSVVSNRNELWAVQK
jgi:5'-3' exonuclease